MSILIKGMEMPKNCWMCPLSVLFEKPRVMLRCKLTKEEVLRYKIDGNCPLHELPPHGRLIDIDRLLLEVNNLINSEKGILQIVSETEKLIRNVPTIIESEE